MPVMSGHEWGIFPSFGRRLMVWLLITLAIVVLMIWLSLGGLEDFGDY